MKGKKYFLDDIKDYAGNTRTDDRYPNRIGSSVQFNQEPILDAPMCFRYVKHDENGDVIEDHITFTTTIKKIENNGSYTYIYTANSIYHFREMESQDDLSKM